MTNLKTTETEEDFASVLEADCLWKKSKPTAKSLCAKWKDLILNVLQKSCPYPEDEKYSKIWDKYKNQPRQQKWMKKNIGPMVDNQREIISMNMRAGALTAQHNGETVFYGDGKSVDKDWAIFPNWITYLTGDAAEGECEKQWKILLEDKEEIERFMNLFPWETIEEKFLNFIELFGLEKTGSVWLFHWKILTFKDSLGYIMLSKVLKTGARSRYRFGLSWGRPDNKYPSICHESWGNDGSGAALPYIAFENIK